MNQYVSPASATTAAPAAIIRELMRNQSRKVSTRSALGAAEVALVVMTGAESEGATGTAEVSLTGLEPVASGLGIQRSIHLSYRDLRTTRGAQGRRGACRPEHGNLPKHPVACPHAGLFRSNGSRRSRP